MKVLVVYDSTYGNTKSLADAIGDALGAGAIVARAADVQPADLAKTELLIVGSPTQGGRPTPATMQLLKSIPTNALREIRVAAFDTRLAAADSNFALRLLMKVIGYAAPRIATALRARGGRLVAEPEGFIVEGKEGPVRQHELDRARTWATAILQATTSADRERALR